ncbi:hypothetical protein [Thermospira aquatica]|uniref:Uncharacterized protein n=1 Tax=Thermospira aquatica TaxID=2828656 RepID=A0AAX3BCT2_9SPIR|nr:hypothetical protein [Thermospira aquatica]URA09903.1 hypothetical protein KDW03_10525 [Thermospira aquatica]
MVGSWAGSWAGNIFGGNNWFTVGIEMGVQRMTESVVESSFMVGAKVYDFKAGKLRDDWASFIGKSILESGMIGFVSGFTTGMIGSALGGTYTNGNLSFLDRKASKAVDKDVSLFYGMKLNNFANTIGSIAGEAVHYAWGGNFRISLASDVGMAFTHDGQIVNDTSGGIGLVNLVDAIGSLNYVGFQYKNVHGGDEGLSRISYVNMGYLSGDMQNMKTSLDVINNKKRIEFDLEGEGNYGYAGEDNRTIHLNREAILADDDAELRAKLAHYTATVMHEGLHLDQHAWLAANGLEADDITLERMAYAQSTMTLALLQANFGLGVGGSKYEEVAMAGAMFAMTGNPHGLYISGRSLSKPRKLPFSEQPYGSETPDQQTQDRENPKATTGATPEEEEEERKKRDRMKKQKAINQTKLKLTLLRIVSTALKGSKVSEWIENQMVKPEVKKLGELYKEQLMDYEKKGNYYISNVDGIEIRMSKYNFSPQAQKAGTGNTPINLATGGMDPRAVLVLIDNAHAVNLDAVEVSSLWRNSTTSPHGSGRGIDIVAATRNGVTVRFNNSTVGQQSTAAMALRNEVYNSMVNDPRVSQALDPWWLKSKVPGKIYDYQNSWQNVNDTYLIPQGVSLAEFEQMTWEQQLPLLGGDPEIARAFKNMLLHRHHLHITLF